MGTQTHTLLHGGIPCLLWFNEFLRLLFVPVSCLNLSFFHLIRKDPAKWVRVSKLDQEGGGFNFFASGASLSLSIFPTVTIYLFRVASAQCSESVHLRCRASCPDISQWAPDSQVIAPNQYHTPNTTVNLRQLLRRRREFAGFVKSHIFNYYIAKYFQKLWKQISECQRNALSLNKYVTQWEYGEDKQKCHGGKFSFGRKMRFYVGRKNSVISFKLVQRNLHSDTTNTHLLY